MVGLTVRVLMGQDLSIVICPAYDKMPNLLTLAPTEGDLEARTLYSTYTANSV